MGSPLRPWGASCGGGFQMAAGEEGLFRGLSHFALLLMTCMWGTPNSASVPACGGAQGPPGLLLGRLGLGPCPPATGALLLGLYRNTPRPPGGKGTPSWGRRAMEPSGLTSPTPRTGIGVGMLVVSSLVSLYYNVIIAWTFYYLSMSFQSPLPWSCDAPHNRPLCQAQVPAGSRVGRKRGGVAGRPRGSSLAKEWGGAGRERPREALCLRCPLPTPHTRVSSCLSEWDSGEQPPSQRQRGLLEVSLLRRRREPLGEVGSLSWGWETQPGEAGHGGATGSASSARASAICEQSSWGG